MYCRTCDGKAAERERSQFIVLGNYSIYWTWEKHLNTVIISLLPGKELGTILFLSLGLRRQKNGSVFCF